LLDKWNKVKELRNSRKYANTSIIFNYYKNSNDEIEDVNSGVLFNCSIEHQTALDETGVNSDNWKSEQKRRDDIKKLDIYGTLYADNKKVTKTET